MADELKPFLKRWWHKLFNCPTFWSIKPRFTCPLCGEHYRCYWDGNDVEGFGKDYCIKCTAALERISHENNVG
jgi:hypothetical protein